MITATRLPRLRSAREIAEQMGLSLARVYQLAREDGMPCIRLGRAMRFDTEAVREWLADGGTTSGEDRGGA